VANAGASVGDALGDAWEDAPADTDASAFASAFMGGACRRPPYGGRRRLNIHFRRSRNPCGVAPVHGLRNLPFESRCGVVSDGTVRSSGRRTGSGMGCWGCCSMHQD